MTPNHNDLDGIERWFFGGTPGPSDLDGPCTLSRPHIAQVDEDDARIVAFAHRCHCRQSALHARDCTEAPRPLNQARAEQLLPCHS